MKNKWNALVFLLIGVFTGAVTLAGPNDPPKKADAAAEKSSDKLDIKELEQRYWSAKDDDFKVVQNRSFSKEKRFFISTSYGSAMNDPNYIGNIVGVNAGWYLNERWGFEFNYNKSSFKFNSTIDEYKSRFGVIPDHNKYDGAMSLIAYYVPIYAKMSLLDQKIIHFDMAIGVGLGQTSYIQNRCASALACTNNANFEMVQEKKSSVHFVFNVMQQFFLTRHWSLRFDVINRWTNEPRLQFTSGNERDHKNINDTALQFGVTYWL